MAFPAFGSAGSLVAELDTSIDVVLPATINANDIIVIAALSRDNNEIDTPSGFTAGDMREQGAAVHAEWFWKRAVGDEDGTTVTVTRVAGTSLFCAVAFTVTGCVTSGNPYDLNGQTGLGNNATWTPADLDPVDAQDRLMLVIAIAAQDLLTAGNYTGGTATVTERLDVETAVGADGTIHVADAQHGADTAFDFGSQTTSGAHGHALFSIGFLPAGGESHSGTSSVSGGGVATTQSKKGGQAASATSSGGSVAGAGAKGGQTGSACSTSGGVVSVGRKGGLSTSTVSGGGLVVSVGTSAESHSGASLVSGGGAATSTGTKGGRSASGVSSGGQAVSAGLRGASSSTSVGGGGAVVSTGRSARFSVSLVTGGGSVNTTGSSIAQAVPAVTHRTTTSPTSGRTKTGPSSGRTSATGDTGRTHTELED